MILSMRLRTAILGPVVCFALGGVAGPIIFHGAFHHARQHYVSPEPDTGSYVPPDISQGEPETADVPEPGTIGLLGSGITMLALVAALRKWRAK